MLTQFLPGFRDFRTPLVTGYIWLICAWILIGRPKPDKTQTSGPVGVLNSLTEFLAAPVLTLVILSFLAYLIGIVATIDLKPGLTRTGIGLSLPWAANKLKVNANNIIDGATHQASLRKIDGTALEREFILPHYIQDREDHDIAWAESGGNQNEYDATIRQASLKAVRDTLLDDMLGSIPALAVKLKEKNQGLYDIYDRDRSEA